MNDSLRYPLSRPRMRSQILEIPTAPLPKKYSDARNGNERFFGQAEFARSVESVMEPVGWIQRLCGELKCTGANKRTHGWSNNVWGEWFKGEQWTQRFRE